MGEGFHAVPPADGVAGVELADQLEQLAFRLGGEPGGGADLAAERLRVAQSTSLVSDTSTITFP